MSTRETSIYRFTAEGKVRRLDKLLAEAMEFPRNQIQKWIVEGLVSVDGDTVKRPSRLVSPGETVECHRPLVTSDPRVSPQEGPLEILYEDSDIVVLDKPPGLVVHPGAGHSSGTLVHRLLARFPEMVSVGGQGRPGIVHRLDQGTSGIMVLARTSKAYLSLSQAFADRRISKTYLAIAYGHFQQQQGRIETPIGRHPQRRKEMTVRSSGRPSLTQYRVLDSAAGLALLEVDLGTGRTHQIRVHLKSISHPLVGDPTYGERRWKVQKGELQAVLRRFPRPALHAWRLAFEHPTESRPVSFEAAVPDDLAELWQMVTGKPWPVATS